jgi:hypothetical protein
VNVSSEYFVVKPRSTRLPDALMGEPAGSDGLFVLRSPHMDAAPRQQWDRLMREHGQHLEFAAPIMVDDNGREMVPTGVVVVQFNHAPIGDDLARFATGYGLRHTGSNEFSANELRFRAIGNDTYLPDLIERLKSDQNVKHAAPETMGRYTRL